MKKKIEKATNLLGILKSDSINIEEKGIDKTIVASIEKSIKELVKIENEISILTEKLSLKIGLKKEKKDALSQIVKDTNKLVKAKTSKRLPDNVDSEKKKEKVKKIIETAEPK